MFAGAIFIQWSNSLTGKLSLIITYLTFLCKKKKIHSKRGIAVYSCPWNPLLTKHISMVIYITLEWMEMKKLHKVKDIIKRVWNKKTNKSWRSVSVSFFLFFFLAYIPRSRNWFIDILFSNYQYYRKDLLGILVFIWVTFTYQLDINSIS